MTNRKKNFLSLYVHWPYCESKCPYCDFNSHVIEDVERTLKAFTEVKEKLDAGAYKADRLAKFSS